MGVVYKAVHGGLKRTVAIKVLSSSKLGDPGAVDRFDREWEAIGRLEHPNIVRATDAGEASGLHFLAMEYVDGVDLSKLVRRVGRLTVAHACELIRQAATGLQYICEQGLVHRDIKPSNLMVSRDCRVKILDLGLALLGENGLAASGLTSRNQIMGTADYMAPEQVIDSHRVDIRADIYSLGCTLYHLLAGRPPFSGPIYDSPFRKLMGHTHGRLPPISGQRSGLPSEFVVILERLLSRDPAQRPSTPGEVAAALVGFASTIGLQSVVERACGNGVAPSATSGEQFRWPDRSDHGDQEIIRADRTAAAPQPRNSDGHRRVRWAGMALGAAAVVCLLASAFGLTKLLERPPVTSKLTEGPPIVSTVQSPEDASDSGGRYLEPPETLLWPTGISSFCNYDSSQRELNVTCSGMGLFEFDKAETDNYEFRAILQQIIGVGRVGVFFGYQVDRRHPDVSVHFQLIETIRGEHGEFTLRRSRVTLTNGVATHADVIGAGAAADRSPAAPHSLRLLVEGGKLQRVLWDGSPVEGLASPEINGRLAAGDCLGACGSFNYQSDSSFRDVMLVLPAETR